MSTAIWKRLMGPHPKPCLTRGWLIAMGASVNAVNNDGWSPFAIACAKGHLKVARLLHEAGADIHAQNGEGERPLHNTADMGQLRVVKWLLSIGAVVDATNHSGWQPLHFACASGHLDVAQALLKDGARLDCQNSDLWTCAHCAAAYGKAAPLRWLHGLEAKMDAVTAMRIKPPAAGACATNNTRRISCCVSCHAARALSSAYVGRPTRSVGPRSTMPLPTAT
jgi:hypothetical protein